MKTHSKSISVLVAAVLLALFAAGGLVGRALALPVTGAVAGLGLVALGLRIGVMVAAIVDGPGAPARPIGSGSGSGAREPVLHAANG